MDFVIEVLSGIGRTVDRIFTDIHCVLGLTMIMLMSGILIDIISPPNGRGNRRSAPDSRGRGADQDKKDLSDPKDFLGGGEYDVFCSEVQKKRSDG